MRKRNLPFLTVVFIVIMILSLTFHVSGQSDIVSYGDAGMTLYVLDLPYVTSQGVDNVNHTVQGVLDAAKVNQTTFVTDRSPLTLGDLNLNINATVIHDWTTYKTLVESDSNFIIVNAHGETLPIPTDYSRVDWVNKIAEALAHRNVTWVHTALYPFYYSYDQVSGESMWGEDGFKQFMSYVGKDNVTCWPTYPGSENDVQGRSGGIQSQLSAWSFGEAKYAQRGNPLHASDFNEDTFLQIWSTGIDVIGAAFKFAEPLNSSFGFYVHIGTRYTYNSTGQQTDGDYFRGYIGTAAAIWAVSFRTASEQAICDAETTIMKAQSEGRTDGLDAAKQALQQAKEDFNQNSYGLALANAKEATPGANSATKPQVPILPVIVAVVLGIALILLGLGLKRRRNSNHK